MFSASSSLGAAHASVVISRDYLKVRKQFGKSLDNFQVRFMLIQQFLQALIDFVL